MKLTIVILASTAVVVSSLTAYNIDWFYNYALSSPKGNDLDLTRLHRYKRCWGKVIGNLFNRGRVSRITIPIYTPPCTRCRHHPRIQPAPVFRRQLKPLKKLHSQTPRSFAPHLPREPAPIQSPRTPRTQPASAPPPAPPPPSVPPHPGFPQPPAKVPIGPVVIPRTVAPSPRIPPVPASPPLPADLVFMFSAIPPTGLAQRANILSQTRKLPVSTSFAFSAPPIPVILSAHITPTLPHPRVPSSLSPVLMPFLGRSSQISHLRAPLATFSNRLRFLQTPRPGAITPRPLVRSSLHLFSRPSAPLPRQLKNSFQRSSLSRRRASLDPSTHLPRKSSAGLTRLRAFSRRKPLNPQATLHNPSPRAASPKRTFGSKHRASSSKEQPASSARLSVHSTKQPPGSPTPEILPDQPHGLGSTSRERPLDPFSGVLPRKRPAGLHISSHGRRRGPHSRSSNGRPSLPASLNRIPKSFGQTRASFSPVSLNLPHRTRDLRRITGAFNTITHSPTRWINIRPKETYSQKPRLTLTPQNKRRGKTSTIVLTLEDNHIRSTGVRATYLLKRPPPEVPKPLFLESINEYLKKITKSAVELPRTGDNRTRAPKKWTQKKQKVTKKQFKHSKQRKWKPGKTNKAAIHHATKKTKNSNRKLLKIITSTLPNRSKRRKARKKVILKPHEQIAETVISNTIKNMFIKESTSSQANQVFNRPDTSKSRKLLLKRQTTNNLHETDILHEAEASSDQNFSSMHSLHSTLQHSHSTTRISEQTKRKTPTDKKNGRIQYKRHTTQKVQELAIFDEASVQSNRSIFTESFTHSLTRTDGSQPVLYTSSVRKEDDRPTDKPQTTIDLEEKEILYENSAESYRSCVPENSPHSLTMTDGQPVSYTTSSVRKEDDSRTDKHQTSIDLEEAILNEDSAETNRSSVKENSPHSFTTTDGGQTVSYTTSSVRKEDDRPTDKYQTTIELEEAILNDDSAETFRSSVIENLSHSFTTTDGGQPVSYTTSSVRKEDDRPTDKHQTTIELEEAILNDDSEESYRSSVKENSPHSFTTTDGGKPVSYTTSPDKMGVNRQTDKGQTTVEYEEVTILYEDSAESTRSIIRKSSVDSFTTTDGGQPVSYTPSSVRKENVRPTDKDQTTVELEEIAILYEDSAESNRSSVKENSPHSLTMADSGKAVSYTTSFVLKKDDRPTDKHQTPPKREEAILYEDSAESNRSIIRESSVDSLTTTDAAKPVSYTTPPDKKGVNRPTDKGKTTLELEEVVILYGDSVENNRSIIRESSADSLTTTDGGKPASYTSSVRKGDDTPTNKHQTTPELEEVAIFYEDSSESNQLIVEVSLAHKLTRTDGGKPVSYSSPSVRNGDDRPTDKRQTMPEVQEKDILNYEETVSIRSHNGEEFTFNKMMAVDENPTKRMVTTTMNHEGPTIERQSTKDTPEGTISNEHAVIGGVQNDVIEGAKRASSDDPEYLKPIEIIIYDTIIEHHRHEDHDSWTAIDKESAYQHEQPDNTMFAHDSHHKET